MPFKIEITGDNGEHAASELLLFVDAIRGIRISYGRGPDESLADAEFSEADEAASRPTAAEVAEADAPKRRRRTKAEIAADAAAEAAKAERPPMSAAEAATVMHKDAVRDPVEDAKATEREMAEAAGQVVEDPPHIAKLKEELAKPLEGEVGDATTLPTEDDIRLAMQQLSAAKDVGATRQLMADFSVARASALAPEKRAEFIAEANRRMKA